MLVEHSQAARLLPLFCQKSRVLWWRGPWCYGAYKMPCVLTLVCSTHKTKLVYRNT